MNYLIGYLLVGFIVSSVHCLFSDEVPYDEAEFLVVMVLFPIVLIAYLLTGWIKLLQIKRIKKDS